MTYSVETDGEIVESGLTLEEAEDLLCRELNGGGDSYIIDDEWRE